MSVQNILTTLLVIIVVAFFAYAIYQAMQQELHLKYQRVYRHNNPWYRSSHPRHLHRCPQGCNKKRQCPYGSLCYNCQGNNPHCCCYDSQCKHCRL